MQKGTVFSSDWLIFRIESNYKIMNDYYKKVHGGGGDRESSSRIGIRVPRVVRKGQSRGEVDIRGIPWRTPTPSTCSPALSSVNSPAYRYPFHQLYRSSWNSRVGLHLPRSRDTNSPNTFTFTLTFALPFVPLNRSRPSDHPSPRHAISRGERRANDNVDREL